MGKDMTIAKKKNTGLGRGLNALLGEVQREEPLVQTSSGDSPAATGGVQNISVAQIKPHPDQPRRYFSDEALEELADSISKRGVIQPIIVRPAGKGGYQLVAGERRWRAAQRAKLHEIPAIVRDLSDEDTLAIALIENIQREDLNPVEEAQAYQRLMDSQGCSHKKIGKLVDKSRSHVANLVRLLALPNSVLQMVAEGDLSMGHARALINSENAAAIAKDVVAQGLSVRQTEKLVRGPRKQAEPPLETKSLDSGNADIAAVERHLEDLLGLKVKITSDSNHSSGQVVIRYGNLDQLDLICQRLSGEGL
ncbi:ParB/RepB/Spo0J family partition protein [Sphingorhabdus sp. Alg239-R122]|uniref:ParB/RepB/Spo0J family partition protein n=1 Tax=Sphingorhabdus sp. Alg239-R122 TaxID=2305989 RepID=UPI001F088734|nr:ParB/RepB/Spo0J family partition protein [Sphingorhabdus sp. Alg239-R122]